MNRKEIMLAKALCIREDEAEYVLQNSGGDYLTLMKNGLPEMNIREELKVQVNAMLEILQEIKHEEREFLSRKEMSNISTLGQYCMTLCGDSNQEEFWALYFDGHNQLIKEKMLHKGTANYSAISPSTILREAILCNALKIAICHNHPSGVLDPSDDDIVATRDLQKAAELLAIVLNDHIIVSHGEYLSLRAEGFVD